MIGKEGLEILQEKLFKMETLCVWLKLTQIKDFKKKFLVFFQTRNPTFRSKTNVQVDWKVSLHSLASCKISLNLLQICQSLTFLIYCGLIWFCWYFCGMTKKKNVFSWICDFMLLPKLHSNQRKLVLLDLLNLRFTNTHEIPENYFQQIVMNSQ